MSFSNYSEQLENYTNQLTNYQDQVDQYKTELANIAESQQEFKTSIGLYKLSHQMSSTLQMSLMLQMLHHPFLVP